MSDPLPPALSILQSPQFWSSPRATPAAEPAPAAPRSDRRDGPARRLHDLLARHSFYPLALCTLLCFGFWAVRIVYTRTVTYDFLVKNLFLAWTPYFLSLFAVRFHARAAVPGALWTQALVWLTWLLMLPNAPYIFTDLIHWKNRPRVMPWWFDLGLVLMFALAGCFCGLVSLRMMHDLVRRALGRVSGWTFVVVVTLLSGFGVYLGRFERWNSWDFFVQPHRLLTRTLYKSFNPYLWDRTVGVTLMFGCMLLVTYVMFVSMSLPTRRSAIAGSRRGR